MKSLSREKDCVLCRLRSIVDDEQHCSKRLLPRIGKCKTFANLRCGRWYLNGMLSCVQADSALEGPFSFCRFKSTDGHSRNLSFSMRRLNLHVLRELILCRAVCIVDASANRTKIFPDSMTRTIPVWACVMNRVLLGFADDPLQPRPEIGFSREECASVESEQMRGWTDSLSRFPYIAALRRLCPVKTLPHPMRIQCVYCSLDDPLTPRFVPRLDSLQSRGDVLLIYLVCPTDRSRVASGDPTYVCGAGDDEESWKETHGIPAAFGPSDLWAASDEILGCRDDKRVLEVICGRLKRTPPAPMRFLHRLAPVVTVDPTPISISTVSVAATSGSVALPCSSDDATTILCFGRLQPKVESESESESESRSSSSPHTHTHTRHTWHVVDEKRLSECLETQLEEILGVVRRVLRRSGRLLLIDEDCGRKVATAVAVAILLAFFDTKLQMDLKKVAKGTVGKSDVAHLLLLLQVSIPDLCPSRQLLKQVNRYFMSPSVFMQKRKKRSDGPTAQ